MQVENIWDHAAGTVLIQEAGGVVTDMLGHPLDFGCGRTFFRVEALGWGARETGLELVRGSG